MTGYMSSAFSTVFIPCGQHWVRLDQIESFEAKNGAIEVSTLSGGIFTYPGTVEDFTAMLRKAGDRA